MLAALTPEALAEVERALLLDLRPQPSAAEQRVAELGALAEMLHEIRPPGAINRADPDAAQRRTRTIPPGLRRETYDAVRPLHAPSSEVLVGRYGSWAKARRAAYGLLPDGRYLGVGRPWPQVTLPERVIYTREDSERAIRRCALDLGRHPSSTFYDRWQRAKKARLAPTAYARERIPGLKRIMQLYKRSWIAAVTAANITDSDLAVARASWAKVLDEDPLEASVIETLRTLPAEVWQRLGLLPYEEALVRDQGAGQLLFSQAAALAQQLGVGLDWLAGASTHHGEPPLDTTFDAARLRAVRVGSGKSIAAVAKGAVLSSAHVRRVLAGSFEPTLDEAGRIARTLAASLDGCVSARQAA